MRYEKISYKPLASIESPSGTSGEVSIRFAPSTRTGSVFLLLLAIPIFPRTPHAITYKIEPWRRLGDMITTVGKADYFAYTYDMKLLYKPFPYSDQFQLHITQQLFTPELASTYSKTVPFTTIAELEKELASADPILFECHFLTQSPILYTFSRTNYHFEQRIKKMFTPLAPIERLPKPEGVITVALHVRKGGGFDRPLASTQEYSKEESPLKGVYLYKHNPAGSYTDVWPLHWPAGQAYIEAVRTLVLKRNLFSDYTWPIKFPPDQYYIDQLTYLAQQFEGKNLLVYLFTDDPNPHAIVERYSAALKEYPRLIFSYRQAGNHHTKNVIHDLFCLAQCDCIISASSSFANAAHLLGSHALIIVPVHAISMPDKIIINKVGVLSVRNPGDPAKRSIAYEERVTKIK